MKKKWKITIGIWVSIFIIIQFSKIDKTNPPENASLTFQQIEKPPAQIMAMLEMSCYDCHSHQSKYPWYSNIAPVSWMLQDHIEEGREHLNFSIWGNYSEKERAELLEEAAEEIEEGKMPLNNYLWMHAEAKLSPAQKTILVGWLKENVNNAAYSKAKEMNEGENEE